MKQQSSIISYNDYQETMRIIYDLMNKGEANLTPAEIIRIKKLSIAAEKYEENYFSR